MSEMDRRGHVKEAYEYCPFFRIFVDYGKMTQKEIEDWIWGGLCDKDGQLPCTFVESLGTCPYGRMKKKRRRKVVRKWPPNIPLYTNFRSNLIYVLTHACHKTRGENDDHHADAVAD